MRNIVLTGFMGTGKSAVGAALARMTGMRLVELDAEIERGAGMSIPDIFASKGEAAFRDMESAAIERFAEGRGAVISTGGGAVIKEKNREMLRKAGPLVCLTASAETIYARTRYGGRPLLDVPDPLGKIKEMLADRAPYYEQSDYMVDTEGRSPFEIAEEILEVTGWKKK